MKNPQSLNNKLNPEQEHELTVAELIALFHATEGDETLFDGALLCCGLTAVAILKGERALPTPSGTELDVTSCQHRPASAGADQPGQDHPLGTQHLGERGHVSDGVHRHLNPRHRGPLSGCADCRLRIRHPDANHDHVRGKPMQTQRIDHEQRNLAGLLPDEQAAMNTAGLMLVRELFGKTRSSLDTDWLAISAAKKRPSAP